MIRKMVVGKESQAVGCSLPDLHVASETGVRVVALRRGKRWLYNPKKIVLKKGDVIIGVGPEEGLEHLEKFLEGKVRVLE